MADNETDTSLSGIVADPKAVESDKAPQQEKEVEDASVIFVPFEDFSGRINQDDFDFRKDVPTKVPKSQANVWLEAKKGYIK